MRLPIGLRWLQCACIVVGLHVAPDSHVDSAGSMRQLGLEIRAPFAVVRPFHDSDVELLRKAFGGRDPIPAACKDVNETLPVDLVLYYSGDTERGQKNYLELRDLARKLPCFHSVVLKFASILPGTPREEAQCLQFVQLYGDSPTVFGYHAMLWMEADMYPTREGWLTDLLPVLDQAARGSFWVSGGVYSPACMVKISDHPLAHRQWLQNHPWTSERKDGHINSNAIYTASHKWTNLVREHEDKCASQSNWDFWIYENYRQKYPVTKWRRDNRFINCRSVNPNYKTMPLDGIQSVYPESLLVHSDAGIDPKRKDANMDLFSKVGDPWGGSEHPVFWHVPLPAGQDFEFRLKDLYHVNELYWLQEQHTWHLREPGSKKAKKGAPADFDDTNNWLSIASLGVVRQAIDGRSKGRIFTVLRHPAGRVRALYQFLRKSKTDNAAKKYDSFGDFFASDQSSSEWMCTELCDLVMMQPHLGTAKSILRDYVLVGLDDQLEESMKRFEKYFGLKYTIDLGARFKSLLLKTDTQERQSLSQYIRPARTNSSCDMDLYEYGHTVFDEQAALFAY